MDKPWNDPKRWEHTSSRGEAYGAGWADAEDHYQQREAKLREALEKLGTCNEEWVATIAIGALVEIDPCLVPKLHKQPCDCFVAWAARERTRLADDWRCPHCKTPLGRALEGGRVECIRGHVTD